MVRRDADGSPVPSGVLRLVRAYELLDVRIMLFPFDPEPVEARLATARGGFLKWVRSRLVSRDYERHISPTLLELVGAMQEMVLKRMVIKGACCTSDVSAPVEMPIRRRR